MFLLVIGLVWAILGIVGLWKVFSKSDEAGWKSIIPIYNEYVLWKISGRSFLRFFAIEFVLLFLSSMFNGGAENGTLIGNLFSLGWCFYSIYEYFMVYRNLAKSFGKGTGFAVGLLFLSPIFLLILGFGDCQYNKIEE